MNRPVLLTFKELEEPIKKARNKIIEVETELASQSSPVIHKSMYSYIFSIFEIMLNDLMRISLKHFPQKLTSKEFKFQKDVLLEVSSPYELVDLEVERTVQNLAYKNLKEYMEEFCSIVSVDNLDPILQDELIERKATRNLLLHNDLQVNDRYIESAGPLKRLDNGTLSLDIGYINNTINYIKNTIDHIEQSLSNKFSQYTKVKALKGLWNYLFTSPILVFDQYWDYTNDTIIALKVDVLRKRLRGGLSSSERKLLAVWIMHFNSQLNKLFMPEDFATYSLGDKRKSDLRYLISVITNYPELFKTP